MILKQRLFPDLNNIYSQVIQNVSVRLDNAFKQYFKKIKENKKLKLKKKVRSPKFRSSKIFFNLLYPQKGYKFINKDKINLSKIGIIKFRNHRKLDLQSLDIKQISISNKDNKFYLNITVEEKQELQINKESIIGIDIGLYNIYATSNSEVVKNTNRENLKYLNKQINKIKSRKDKCKRGSRKNKFLSSIIKRLHEKKYRKTNDFLHKISKDITNKADVIVVEDLSVKNMSETEKTGLNRNIRDNCLSKLLGFIKYKAKRFISINPYNTSKTCSSCGNIKTGLQLSDRTYNCSHCGISIDRDINAAINILCLGQDSIFDAVL